MNIKIGILNVPKHCNKHDLIHFVTITLYNIDIQVEIKYFNNVEIR